MKSTHLILFFLLTQFITAQTFTEIPDTPFDGIGSGSIAFSDVNSDGHKDFLIAGLSNSGEFFAKLFTNDGTGTFTELADTPFEDAVNGSVAFSDVNGDGHEDVLITGLNNLTERIAKLYTNDGTGTFTEMTGTPFVGVATGSQGLFNDVNGDGHPDILIAGSTASDGLITKLYTNDGTGSFNEISNTSFEGVADASIAFSDVNGDGHDDVLITGSNNSLERIAKLYTNDGSGIFTEMTGTPFDGVTSGSIAFSDVNGDGNEDVLITGQNNSDMLITKLYANDGTGIFTEMMDTPFDNVGFSSIAFSDINGDGFEDVLITGDNNLFERVAKLYTNDGTGTFTELAGTPFVDVWFSSVAFSDIDGDGRSDVCISGEDSLFERVTKLYRNEGIVSSFVDLNDEMDLNFKIFPNPSQSSSLFLSFAPTEVSEVTITISTVDGRLLFQQKEYAKNGEQAFVIDISTLTNGIYSIKLDDGKRKGIAKFIVQ